MEFTLNVTEEHIQKGVRRDICSCPIAKALWSQGWKHANVQPYGASVTRDYQCFWIPFQSDSAIAAFVLAFDKGQPVEPQSFTLEVLSYFRPHCKWSS